jgi:hypothetical protein
LWLLWQQLLQPMQFLQFLDLPNGLLLRAQSVLQRLREKHVHLQLLLKHGEPRLIGRHPAQQRTQLENEQQFARENVRD